MKRNLMTLLLVLCAAAAGAWVPQVNRDGDVEDVKTIDLIGPGFSFEPANITVAQGDTVRLGLHSTDRTHGLAIEAFRVKARRPREGQMFGAPRFL